MLREIKFLCLERSAEDFADMMMDAGAMSVSIEDADLGSPDEKPLYGEPGTEPDTFAWNRSIVSVLADDTFDASQAAAIAAVINEVRYDGTRRRLGAHHAGSVLPGKGKRPTLDRSELA